MSAVQQVSQATFSREVLQANVPVLVDFYADWCGPCRRLGPTLDRLAVEFAGRAKIVKVNVDAEQGLANQFQVESIPTLAIVSGGKLLGKTAGLVPEAQLRQALHQCLNAGPGAARQVG
ncbi:MAG: thioredoxin [Pirellulales bacterium]